MMTIKVVKELIKVDTMAMGIDGEQGKRVRKKIRTTIRDIVEEIIPKKEREELNDNK